jgi:TonB family protein
VSATLVMERKRDGEPAVLPFALALAFGAHLAVAWLTPSSDDLPEPPPAPLEVVLNEPPVPPPKPMRERVPEAVTPLRRGVVAAPAKAAKLLTAEPAVAPTVAGGPLDFVSGAAGKGYGFGVVSVGGTTSGEGVKAAGTAALVSSAPLAPALVGAADLSERPHLLVDDPCRGFFPGGANADSATAVVRVVIEASGKVRTVTLVEEAPAGQGFGAAARQCVRAQRFSVPRDHDGRAVATATTIRVRFER